MCGLWWLTMPISLLRTHEGLSLAMSHTFSVWSMETYHAHIFIEDTWRFIISYVSYFQCTVYGGLPLGLPRLRNLVNVYTSSTNRNNPVYTKLPDMIIFMMQIGKIADIFPKKTPWKMYLARIFEISWLGVVIELISSYWKVIATCAYS